MARTHGTRSAYNAGCRCDACREASRLARARQRAAVEASSYGAGDEWSVASTEGGSVPWGLVGLVGLGAGGFALWHGATMKAADDADPEGMRRARRNWCLAGAVLVIVGVIVLAHVN